MRKSKVRYYLKRRSGMFLVKYFLMGCLMIGSMVSAQDIKADLRGIYETYSTVERFMADLQVDVFQNAEDKKALITYLYTIKKDGLNYFYTTEGTDYLFNENCALMANKEERYMHYSQHENVPKKAPSAVQINVDSVIQLCDSVAFLGQEGITKKYRVYAYDQPIPVMDFYFDDEKKVLSKLIYLYNESNNGEKNKVVITYKNWNNSPQFSEHTFSEWNYIVKKDREIVPNERYRGFMIIHDTSNKK